MLVYSQSLAQTVVVVEIAQFLLFIPVNHEVEEAVSPVFNPMRVEVAFSVTPKFVPVVNGKAPPPAPVASFPSQRSALPVIVAQFGVSTPAVLSRPVPVKSVKDSLFNRNAPPVMVKTFEDDSPAVETLPEKVEVEFA